MGGADGEGENGAAGGIDSQSDDDLDQPKSQKDKSGAGRKGKKAADKAKKGK